MNTSILKKQLESDEGKRLKSYFDTEGYATIGIGHKVLPSDGITDSITECKCTQLFMADVLKALDTCCLLVPNFYHQPEEVQQILANMAFNLGMTRLKGFKRFLKAIIDCDYTKAAIEMKDSLWYLQVKDRAKRLVTRMESM